MTEGNSNGTADGSAVGKAAVVGDERHGDVARVDVVFGGFPPPADAAGEAAPQEKRVTPEQLDQMAVELEARSPFIQESPRRAAWRGIITATSEYWIASQPDERCNPARGLDYIPRVIPIIAPYVKLDAKTTIWPGTIEPGKCSISYRLDSLPDEAMLEVVRAIDPKLEKRVEALFGKDLSHELGRFYDDLEDARHADDAKFAQGTGMDELFRAVWSIKGLVGRWNKIVFPDMKSLVALMDEDTGKAFARYIDWCDGRQPTTLRLSPDDTLLEKKAEPGQQAPPVISLPAKQGILVIDSDNIYTMKRDGERTYAALLPELPFVDHAALPPSNEVFEKDLRGEDKLVKYITQNLAEREGVLDAVGNYNFLRQRIGNRDHIALYAVTESDGKGGVTVGQNKKRVVESRFVKAIVHQAKFVLDSLVDQYRPKPEY
jgi:hypothetical protein